MTSKEIHALQKSFWLSGATCELDFRISQLFALKNALKDNETKLLEALHKDLGKPHFEGFSSELGFCYDEISFVMKRLVHWSKPRQMKTPWLHWPSRSSIHYEPRGVTLILGPWNYPLQLVVAPLIASIAAGNCAVVKPSELAPHTAKIFTKIINKTFPPEYCCAIAGDASVAQDLLTQPFDLVFYTGGGKVAREVLAAASAHLTPVVLELGGKSPCIVEPSAKLEITAKRIVWGKFYNAGQTCVAPDYLLVHESIKEALVAKMLQAITSFYGEDPLQSPDYGRIINTRHWDRLHELVTKRQCLTGGVGVHEQCYLAPTLLEISDSTDPLMQDEIFGPILPILTYTSLEQALSIIKEHPNPLACYIFSDDVEKAQEIMQKVPCGGGCINNVLLHATNPHLPFGGRSQSGMGRYHGRFGYETFSHAKAVMETPFWWDLRLKYPPYRKGGLALLRSLMR